MPRTRTQRTSSRPGRGSSAIADVRPFLLKADDALGDALARMSANGGGFGVVAEDRTVLGTVVDAEIRTALLEGAGAASPVSGLMAKGLTRRARLPAELTVDQGRLVDVTLTPAAGPPPVAVVMA